MKDIIGNVYNNLELLPEDSSGWNSTSSVFGELVEKIKPKTIIEVGSWKGGSVISMAKKTKELGLDTTIYCVDTWLGAAEFWTKYRNTEDRDLMFKNGYPQIYYQFASNMVHNNINDVVYPLPLPSVIAYDVLRYHGVLADLIYIDASHEYEDVLADITNFYNLLRPGGIMFGDDFTHLWPGVEKAVKEYFNENFTVRDNNFWIHES